MKGHTLADDSYPYEETLIERKILLFEEQLVFFNGNHQIFLKAFEKAATALEINGLGELTKDKKISNPTKVFHKV